MNVNENVSTFPRDHQHCMDRSGINYVSCTSLTHCPSICDCGPDCTAEQISRTVNYLTVEPKDGLMYVSANNSTDDIYVPVILFPREARELIAQLEAAIKVSEGL